MDYFRTKLTKSCHDKGFPALVGPSVRFLHIVVKRGRIILKETKILNVFLLILGQEARQELFFMKCHGTSLHGQGEYEPEKKDLGESDQRLDLSKTSKARSRNVLLTQLCLIKGREVRI